LQWIKALLFGLLLSFPAISSNQLPDIGTAGVLALPLEQEIRYGKAYMKIIRASLPILYDPVLNEYTSALGNKLVSNADSVKTPFNFFLIQDNEINAAAFLGGNVKIHTGLFLYASNESELASVIAHEIVHVTQRHLARSMEEQIKDSTMTYAGIVGAILVGLANPLAGIAVLQGALAVNMQASINYTRSNEFEADRIGMSILVNAGYNPEGMGTFFGKLAEKYRFASTPPQMLLTHPLPDTRVAEARARASHYSHRYYPPSLLFGLAKSRILVRYSGQSAASALQLFENQLTRKNYQLKTAALYGKALALLELKRTKEALKIISPLAKEHPDNLFFLDTLTDIDMALNQSDRAIKRLEHYANSFINNSVVIINLANIYNTQKKYNQAAKLLDLFVRKQPANVLAWSMLSDSYKNLGDIGQMHAAKAEIFILKADYQRAIDEFNSSLAALSIGSAKARIEARLVQVNQEKVLFESLQE